MTESVCVQLHMAALTSSNGLLRMGVPGITRNVTKRPKGGNFCTCVIGSQSNGSEC